MGIDTAARQRVVRARAGLVLEHPFFGHLALRMTLMEDRTCDTAWSDGRRLAYNPSYIKVLTHEKLKGLMGHVTMHPACRHHLRRNERDPRLWNMACDYAINWILLEAGLSLPDGYLDDPKFREKTAEDVYTHLEDERTRESSGSQNRTAETPDSADDEAIELTVNVDASMGQNRKSETEDRTTSSQQAVPADDARAGDEQEFPRTDPGRSGEVRDAPPPDEGAGGWGDETPEESRWRINLAQAASQARSMGDFPAELERLVERMLSPKLDWRQLLHRFIQASARCDYAWMPPNRRYLHKGLYLPAMRSTDLPEVVVAVDTSGSVSARELDQFAAELSAILATCAQTVFVLYCDSKVARAETVHRQDLPLALAPIGGGGTDFKPAMEWVERQGIRPLCLIYLTDLACNRFPKPPPYPVLWAHVGDASMPPPFGECISIV